MVTSYTCPYLVIMTVLFHVLMVQYKKKLDIKLNRKKNHPNMSLYRYRLTRDKLATKME